MQTYIIDVINPGVTVSLVHHIYFGQLRIMQLQSEVYLENNIFINLVHVPFKKKWNLRIAYAGRQV